MPKTRWHDGQGSTEGDPLLWRAARARNTDPETSHAAAGTVKVTELEGRVLAALRMVGRRGMTSEEAAEYLGVSLQSISPRFAPMAARGLINRARGEMGNVLKRPGQSGRGRQVWIAEGQP